ncbi:MAG: LL-diaminopimelate aminotransferase [Parachlamydiaceae bacterium]|nr:LL-diaminopimelate aminotransferase [Parachlamydiaceae bacterium]
MQRNPHLQKLKNQYLFPEITSRKNLFIEKNPEASLISLGIGDTTEPIPEYITESLSKNAAALGTIEGYSGYGAPQGLHSLRESIAAKVYSQKIHFNEVFISDGAKCDLGRLQMLFGNKVSIAVQDPAYPVYIDGSIIQGVETIILMPCTPENDFFPNLKELQRTDLIYFCSPNNPTGATATRQQLEQLVAFAVKNHSIIIFDAAYANFIQDSSLPKSIYEIEGAKQVAIEIGSFSKLAGFTGVRLGWTVVPDELKYDDGSSVKSDWNRLISTVFNAASNISQHGGQAVLEPKGWEEVQKLTKFYMENAKILKSTLEELGYAVFGGVHAPYMWVSTQGQKSWDTFHHFLERYHLITTPGSGFGPSGEGFIRLTAFGKREDILTAADRLKKSTYD